MTVEALIYLLAGMTEFFSFQGTQDQLLEMFEAERTIKKYPLFVALEKMKEADLFRKSGIADHYMVLEDIIISVRTVCRRL